MGKTQRKNNPDKPAIHMTWEELVELLISFGEKVHVVRGEGADAVSLQLAPVAWFVSIKSSGNLSMGIYEGDDLRLAGTRTIPLSELEPDFLRCEVATALAKCISTLLDQNAARDFLAQRKGRKRF